MKITVGVKTNASKEGVTKVDDMHYTVATHATPEKGRANREVVRLLADFFKVAQSRVTILAGHVSKNKIIEIR